METAAEPGLWPSKQRDFQNHSMDSTRWNAFRFRSGDIIVASWAKSGTTWVQQILGQLIFGGVENLPVVDLCPWVEQRYLPLEKLMQLVEQQTHRRFLKTHLPADAIVFSPAARYIYVGRDGRDALWSWHNHHRQMTSLALRLLNSVPDRVGPPLGPACADVRKFFHEWLDGDGYPVWPFWENVRTWWNLRHLPNVLLVHFNELKRDLRAQIRRIARFLSIDASAELLDLVTERSGFEYMKAHGSALSRMLASAFARGADDFIYRGTNGRWRDVLTPDDLLKYESHMSRNLSPACAHWLCTGELPATL